MQKQTLTIVAVIIGLALTIYGGHIFLDIKAGHAQIVGPEKRQSIQLGLSDKQAVSTAPGWTLVRHTAALDLPARNPDTIRVVSDPLTEAYRSPDGATQFFIAGIIVEKQAENAETQPVFSHGDQPQLVNAGNTHPSNRDLAIN
jgi:hypothetical protein